MKAWTSTFALALCSLLAPGSGSSSAAGAPPLAQDAGTLKRLIGTGDPRPSGGFFTGAYWPRINDHDHVVFREYPFGGLYYVDNFRVFKIAETGDPAPRGGFFDVGATDEYEINNAGQVIFRSNLFNAGGAHAGIFVYNYHTGALTEVVRTGDGIPDLGVVDQLWSADINDNGRVVVLAGAGSVSGVVKASFDGASNSWVKARLTGSGSPINDTSSAKWQNMSIMQVAYPALHPRVRINNGGTVIAPCQVMGDWQDPDGNLQRNMVDGVVLSMSWGGGPVFTAFMQSQVLGFPSTFLFQNFLRLNDLNQFVLTTDPVIYAGSALGGPARAIVKRNDPSVLGGTWNGVDTGQHSLNDLGTYAFGASYNVPGDLDAHGIAMGNVAGAFSKLVVRGDPAPPAGTYLLVGFPAVNNEGCVAYSGRRVGAGITPSPDDAIWTCRDLNREVDLDIDSDNTNGFGPPDESSTEDSMEANPDPGVPGKKVPVNHFDKDFDGVIDFADGFDAALAPNLGERQNRYEAFTPLVLKIPPGYDPGQVLIRLDYSGSDPQGVSFVDGKYRAAPGMLRAWKKPGNAARRKQPASTPGGDFVAPGVFYTGTQLGLAGNRLLLHLECVAPGERTAITAVVRPDGTAGSETSDVVHVTPAPCPEAIAPDSGVIAGDPSEWSMTWDVSAQDGLVVQDVRLRGRYMAAQMSVPYVSVAVAGGPSRKVRLTPRPVSGEPVQSHLVDLRRYTDPDDPMPLLILTATYALEGFPEAPEACLLVTQRYEFRKLDPNEHVEPSDSTKINRGPARASRFKPIVAFSFHGPPGAQIDDLEIPQRLNFRVDGVVPNAAMFIQDEDELPSSVFDVPYVVPGGNPALREATYLGLRPGLPGDVDNFHQSFLNKLDEPFPVPPGVPEGVHVHWRWGTFLVFPDALSAGRPLTPRPQSLEVALVRNGGPGEVNPWNLPGGWRDLVNAEEIAVLDVIPVPEGPPAIIPRATADLVFWYAGRVNAGVPASSREANAFFTHGGFFSPVRPPHLHLPRNRVRVRANESVELSAEVEEGEPGSALEYAWDFGDGGIQDWQPVASGQNVSVERTYAAPGEYIVTVMARDQDGNWAAVGILLTVDAPPENGAPIAAAGQDQIVEQSGLAGSIVTLDGTGSFDPDGDPLAFVWSGPFGVALGASPHVSLPLGAHDLTLSVDDGRGGVASDVVRVTVADTIPPVFASALPPVNLTASGPGGVPHVLPIPSVSDVCDAAPEVLSDQPSVFPLGTTVVTFTATDASGNQSTARQTVTVAAQGDTTPPVIRSIVAVPFALWPADGRLVTVRLFVDAVDPGGGPVVSRIERVEAVDVGRGGGAEGGPDWIVTGDLTVRLRAERIRGIRLYRITVRSADAAGNAARRDVYVPVLPIPFVFRR